MKKIRLNLEHKILELPEDVVFLDESFAGAGVEHLSEGGSEKALHLWYGSKDEAVVYDEADKIRYVLKKRGLLDTSIRTGYNLPETGSPVVYLEGNFDVDFVGGSHE